MKGFCKVHKVEIKRILTKNKNISKKKTSKMIWKRNLDYRTEVYYQKSFNELKFIILGSPVIYFDFYTPNGDKIMKKLGKNLFLFLKLKNTCLKR